MLQAHIKTVLKKDLEFLVWYLQVFTKLLIYTHSGKLSKLQFYLNSFVFEWLYAIGLKTVTHGKGYWASKLNQSFDMRLY